MSEQRWKAQYWNGSQDGEVGEWKDVEDVPMFKSESEGFAWEMDNQEDYARCGTRIVGEAK